MMGTAADVQAVAVVAAAQAIPAQSLLTVTVEAEITAAAVGVLDYRDKRIRLKAAIPAGRGALAAGAAPAIPGWLVLLVMATAATAASAVVPAKVKIAAAILALLAELAAVVVAVAERWVARFLTTVAASPSTTAPFTTTQ
jgi:hypothetical protein